MPNTQDKIVRLLDGSNQSLFATIRQIGSEGALVTIPSGGTLVNESFDYIGVNYPDDHTEIYTYNKGGILGTTVATITVVFSDNTKNVLLSVTRT